MTAFAAVMTGSGAGAIATIQFCGDRAEAVLSEVFRPSGNGRAVFETGGILLGHIMDGEDPIDQVTVGCESPQTFAIHCHGNPLLVERIMKQLQSQGVELLDAEAMLGRIFSKEEPADSIAAEAKLVLTKAKTVEGARIIIEQIEGGLSQRVRQWSGQIDATQPGEIADEARQILRDSEIARRIISGCTIVLIGPPNTGKSTLLNALAGSETAIVTDFAGTTRDWVSVEMLMPPIAATLIDTAGLDAELAATSEAGIDLAAQARSREMIGRADLVLLVLDRSQPKASVDERLLQSLSGKPVLTVLNKADLPSQPNADLPPTLGLAVRISAKHAMGLDGLIATIHRALAVADFPPNAPVAFTPRQHALLGHLIAATHPADAAPILANLLRGPIQD
jgi:tRNA modification GTPase